MTFYELAGKGARAQLEALAGTLESGTTELLESTTQPGLFLLVCRAEHVPADLPEGLRVWQFRQVG